MLVLCHPSRGVGRGAPCAVGLGPSDNPLATPGRPARLARTPSHEMDSSPGRFLAAPTPSILEGSRLQTTAKKKKRGAGHPCTQRSM